MIREADYTDIDRIFELGIEAQSKAAAPFQVEPIRARKTIAQFVQSPARFAWVLDVKEVIQGVLLGGIEPVWYSADKQASDLLFYVTDNPCATGGGRMLLKKFMAWSKDRGAKGMMMAVSMGGPSTQNTDKMYRKLGFETIGSMHLLSLED